MRDLAHQSSVGGAVGRSFPHQGATDTDGVVLPSGQEAQTLELAQSPRDSLAGEGRTDGRRNNVSRFRCTWGSVGKWKPPPHWLAVERLEAATCARFLIGDSIPCISKNNKNKIVGEEVVSGWRGWNDNKQQKWGTGCGGGGPSHEKTVSGPLLSP